MHSHAGSTMRTLAAAALLLTIASTSFAQAGSREGFGVCKPVSQRNGARLGCWILARADMGVISEKEVYWHLDVFASRSAAEAARSPRSVVLRALGRTWLATVEAKGWRPAGGKRVAEIGPIPLQAGKHYSAVYMEAIAKPGAKSAIHTHSGPEAWYTESGETCLETPQGRISGRPGDMTTVVPAGPAMELTAVGPHERRGLTLILHDASLPPTTIQGTWKPRGLCGA